MDVLFVTPTSSPEFLNESSGTLLLATILREKGMDVDIHRFFEVDESIGFDGFISETVRLIMSKQPKIVSFYCRCDCYLANIMIAREIKKLKPEIVTVFGGPQADVSGRETLIQLDWIDYCCAGEGEETVYPLFSSIIHGEADTSVAGLMYRDRSGEVIANPRPSLRMNLDDAPFIDYSLVPEEIMRQVREKGASVPVDVGRGCPFNCVYCSTSLFWERKFRIKSADRLIREIDFLVNELGAKCVSFEHDLFTGNRKYLFDFCQKLIDSGIKVSWDCSARVDTLDEELIDIMCKAGMSAVYLGIETGSQRMQKVISKNLKVDRVKDVIRMLEDRGVKITASFIYGFPEETEDDLELTYQLVYELMEMNVHSIQMHLCAIFPGTRYFEMYKDKLVFANIYSDQVSDFGVQENFEFIDSHKDIFAFYYEYRNELREKFSKGGYYWFYFFIYLSKLKKLDPERFGNTRIVDMYSLFIKANENVLEVDGTEIDIDTKDTKYINNFCDAVYGDDSEKVKDILEFFGTLEEIGSRKEDAAEITVCSFNAKDVIDGKTIDDIGSAPTMVHIEKTGERINYRIQPFGRLLQ